MIAQTRSALAAATLLALSGAAHAELSGGVTVTSNYLFDGVSQTDNNPAIQPTLTWTFDNGIYVGGWFSNVDFGEANIEQDYYVGWSGALNDSLSMDVGAVAYRYAGAPSKGYDYNEYYVGLTFMENTSWKYWYAHDSDVWHGTAWRTNLVHNIALPNDFGLALEASYTRFKDAADYYEISDDDQLHARVGLSHDWAGFSFDLSFHWTDHNDDFYDSDLNRSTAVLSISKNF